jgi:putative membrane protein
MMWGSEWGWLPMMLSMVLFWGAVIWFAVWLFWRTNRRPSREGTRSDPRAILEERFARGEIDEEEFGRRTKVLGAS